jgi:hypothetical protein
MTVLKRNWKSRTLWISAISIIAALIMMTLTFTDWADAMRIGGELAIQGSDGTQPEREIPAVLMYIVPFIKEFVLIGVPMLLGIGIGRIYKKLKKSSLTSG